MGANESNPVRNLDKRTARREYKGFFQEAISSYRSSLVLSEDAHLPRGKSARQITVCIRKRPFFRRESDEGEFDVITCCVHRGVEEEEGNSGLVVIHDARMHSDMKRMLLNSYHFNFDKVFSEKAKNEDVYDDACSANVKRACEGMYVTVMVYGQTGSGKTFTMSSIYEMAARDIFEENQNHPTDSKLKVSVSFFEIAGESTAADLLNQFQSCQILTAVDGTVHPYPIVEVGVSSAEELMAMIRHGISIRSTSETGVHDKSSRSHALLRIYIKRSTGDEGVLNLVDLAGSEHRIDSMYHNGDRRKETANINTSLMALKDCIRANVAGKRDLKHLYRKSKLTMLLKGSFENPNAHTTVIATVSPASKDTEHSLNTLRHSLLMDGQSTATATATDCVSVSAETEAEKKQQGKETRFLTGGSCVSTVVGTINVTEITRRRKMMGGQPEELLTSNGNNNIKANSSHELTEKEKEKAKRLNERRSMSKMHPSHREILLNARSRLGDEPRQFNRLRNPAPFRDEDGVFSNHSNEMLNRDNMEDDDDHRQEKRGAILSNCGEFVGKDENLQQCSSNLSSISKSMEKNDRKSFKKLYSSIYNGGAAETTPAPILHRQLVTLMKMNGYSIDEIKKLAPIHSENPPKPPSMSLSSHSKRVPQDLYPPQSQSQSQSQSVSTMSRSKISFENHINESDVPDYSNTKNSTAVVRRKSVNNSNQHALAAASVAVEDEIQKRQNRQAAAQEKRKQIELERIQKIQNRGGEITRITSQPTNDQQNLCAGNSSAESQPFKATTDSVIDISVLENLILKIENESKLSHYSSNEVSNMTKQVSHYRSLLLREKRKFEMKQRYNKPIPAIRSQPSSFIPPNNNIAFRLHENFSALSSEQLYQQQLPQYDYQHRKIDVDGELSHAFARRQVQAPAQDTLDCQIASQMLEGQIRSSGTNSREGDLRKQATLSITNVKAIRDNFSFPPQRINRQQLGAASAPFGNACNDEEFWNN